MTDFPVLIQVIGREMQGYYAAHCPLSVPWALLAPHEKQAWLSHNQSLSRLAERGGLAPCEMVAVIEDRKWSRMDDAKAIATLKDYVAAFNATDGAA